MALSTASQFEVMRHSRLRRTIGLPRRAGATTCLPTFYYLSRPTKAPLFRSILLRSRLLSFALGFIRSTSILRRVAHTNVSLILLHSILYSFYPSAYSLLSFCPPFLCFSPSSAILSSPVSTSFRF